MEPPITAASTMQAVALRAAFEGCPGLVVPSLMRFFIASFLS
jgi:hypothetical protein